MNIIFCHDHKFRIISGEVYSTGGLSDDVLTRYTELFGNVTVVARKIKEDKADEKYSKIINNRVKIIGIKEISYNSLINLVKDSDCVISRLPSVIGSEIIEIAKKLKKPYLIEMVACPWDSLVNHSLKGKIVAPLFVAITKKQVKEAKYTLYVTNKFLQKRYPTNGRSIGCSDVSLDAFDKNILSKRINHIKTHNDKMILGTTAAVNVRYKGQEFVIQALAILKKKGITNFEYQLVGNGDNSYLKNLAKKLGVIKQVKFLGGKPHEQVFDWLDAIDIYIQPSLQEGLPRALVEAQSRALPCIGSSTGGIPELLLDDCIFDRKKNMAQAIADWLMNINQEKLLKYAENNFKEAYKYQKEVLDKKRKKFYMSFKTYVERRNGATN